MAGKQSKGKQKIEIKRIENEDARQVTFSKRRTGAFKKASELTTLCGADVMLLVFSPAGRPYSFGQPDVDEVIDRFLSPGSQPLIPDMVQAHRTNVVHQLNQECAELAKRSDAMRARRAILEERVKAATGDRKPVWKKSGFEAFNLEELQHLSKDLRELKLRAEGRVTEILSGGGASSSRAPLAVSPISTLNPFAVGGLNHHQLCDGTMGFDPKFN